MAPLIDLHSHTFHSDGVLVPSELARRAEVAGYDRLAMTDHVDASNIEQVLGALRRAADVINRHTDLRVLVGCELTHVPPAAIGELTQEARRLGAQIVLMHGETIVEPVAPGTNMAAIEAGVDILAHPGLISEDEAKAAAERGVALEITARKGHSLTNGHVAAVGRACGCRFSIGSDAHEPGDLLSAEHLSHVLRGAGLSDSEMDAVVESTLNLAETAEDR